MNLIECNIERISTSPNNNNWLGGRKSKIQKYRIDILS